MRKLALTCVFVVLAVLPLLAQFTGDVLGSHDLSPGGTSPTKGGMTAPCQYCHAPHSGIGGNTPLWSQTLSTQTYTLYGSTTEQQNRSAVSLAEARAYYGKNPKQFSHGESFAIQAISIVPAEKATPDVLQAARKRAEDALRQAKATKSYQEFGLLAEKISQDDYRVNMGDHHEVTRENLPPEILKAVQAMQPGQVSDLILVGNLFTIVRLNAHVAAGEVSFDSVKDRLRSDLQKSKYNELRSDLNRRLRKNAKIEEL